MAEAAFRQSPTIKTHTSPQPSRCTGPTKSGIIFFVLGRPHHEEHPFPPALGIPHPGKLSFLGSDNATAGSTIATFARWRHARSPHQYSHSIFAERPLHRHREYGMDSAIAGRQHHHPEESPRHRTR